MKLGQFQSNKPLRIHLNTTRIAALKLAALKPFKRHVFILGNAGISIADLSNLTGIAKKSIRRKFRGLRDSLPATVTEGKWLFNIDDKDLLIDLLA